ncbi:hypothetical protein ACIHIX_40140 [Streptomyces sp. NPDC051913]|uniref:hypothetical protein n=1 Tax=Streptomyces sp. NPDC051913 TaxID=3365676 RepID=UPI0037D2AD8C
MPVSSRNRRVCRAGVAAFGAAALIALAAAPAAFGDEPEPELVVGGLTAVDDVKPGDGFDVPVTVANKSVGTAPEKVWITYDITRGLEFEEVPSNCLIQHVRPYDEMPERWTASCEFDQALESGVVYTPETAMGVKALGRALNEQLRVRVADGGPAYEDNGTDPVAGPAPAVKLVEAQTGVAGSAQVVTVPVTAVNTADYQVTGDALRGSVGDTVTMKATFTNAGPAWVWPREGDPSVSVVITPPAGTSVVKRGQFCRAKADTYVCGMRSLNEGSQETYTFELKIDKRVAGAEGSVALSSEARPFDPDKTNDRAAITLDVTGGGPSDSTGGSTGSTTGGADTSGGGSSSTGGGTASGGNGSTTGGSGTTTGGTGTTTGGNLADTGSSTLPLAGAAAAAVTLGAGTFLIVRRRRTQDMN